jgi:hypothetical protein
MVKQFRKRRAILIVPDADHMPDPKQPF